MATGGFGGVDPTKRIDDVLRRLDAEVDAMAAAHRRLNEAARRLERPAGRASGGAIPVSGPRRTGGGLRPGPVSPVPAFVPPGSGGGGVVPPIPPDEPAATRSLTSARRSLNSTTLQQISVMGAANRRTQESGALTSQFLEEMRQGRTTLRQFGDEALATAGKFGGWVAAAGAIYGLLGAVGQIGEGAMEGQSSVELLKRSVEDVDEGAAGAKFRALARHFRIGIGEVGEVAFGLGKVFHDQEEVFKAAEAGLLAVQVADLSPENAHRFLGAIAQGAGVAADELEGVVDIANKLQEAFGAETTGLIEGTAKAAGAWTNAGGQLDFLMTLIGIGQSITGASGVEVATAFKRAPAMVRKADAQRVLAEFGIEGALPLPDIIREALKQAPRLSGEDLRRLGAAIGGPQWGANVITPILAQSDLIGRAFGAVEGGRASGSARSELEKVQKQLKNVLEGIASQLNSIGSVLDRTGMLDSFKALIGLLTTTLQIVNLIGEQFASLPAPLRQMVAYAAQFAILMKGLRLVNVSDSLQQGSFLAEFLRHPRQREKILGRALDETDKALTKEYASNQTALTRQKRSLDVARGLEAEAARAMAADTATGEQRKQAAKAHAQAEAEIAAIKKRIYQLEIEEQAIERDRKSALAARADLKARQMAPDAIAAKHGIVLPAELDAEAQKEAEYMRRVREGKSVPPPSTFVAGGGWNQQRIDEFRREGGRFGVIGAGYKRAMDRVRQETVRQGSILRAGATAVKAAGRGLMALGRGVLGFLGPVGLAFAALMFLPEALNKVGDALFGHQRRMAAAQRAISTVAKRPKEFEEQIEDLLESFDKENWELADALIRQREEALKQIRAGNTQVRFAAGTVTIPDLKRMAKESGEDLEAGRITPEEHIRFLRHLDEVAKNHNLKFREATGALDEAEADEVALIQARGKMLLARTTDSIEKARVTVRIAQQVANAVRASSDSSEADIINAQAEVLEAQNALQEQVDKEARELAEAKDNLWVSRARTATQKAVRSVTAARNALRRVAQASDASKADLVRARQTLEEAKREAADQIAEEAVELGRLRDDLRMSTVTGDLQRAWVAVQNAARNLERIRNNPVSDPNEQAKLLIQGQIDYNEAVRAYAEQQAREADDVAGALDRLWVAQASTSTEQARRSLVASQRALERLQSDPNATRSQIIDAQTTVVENRKAYTEALKAEAEALRESRFALARARASDDPVAVARIGAREARALLRQAETPAERNQALATLITARKSRRDAIVQQRLDDIQFDADMERITAEQEIRALEHMLRTMKMSKQMRRNIQRQIHQLKKDLSDGDFGLNVGNIRLPTAYEIRRAIRGGMGPIGPQAGLQYNAVNNVTINVHGVDDPEVLGRLMYDSISPNRSSMASAGLVA